MELIIKNNLEQEIPQKIDFNYEQLKEQLGEKLERYKNLVVTEDSIKAAKSDKALLNKLKTALDDKRKEVKRECLRPFEEFESKIKILISMVDEPVIAIDSQIKVFDEQKKTEKKENIIAYFNGAIGDLKDLLPIEKLWSDRWLNATYKTADITEEIDKSVFKVKNDIGIIKAMHVECEQQMLDTYLRTLDMSAALAEKTRFEEQQKRLKEYEQKQEVKVVDADHGFDEVNPGDRVVFGGNPETPSQPQYTASSAPQEAEQTKTIKVIFHDTTAAFRAEMRALTEKHNIKYGGIN